MLARQTPGMYGVSKEQDGRVLYICKPFCWPPQPAESRHGPIYSYTDAFGRLSRSHKAVSHDLTDAFGRLSRSHKAVSHDLTDAFGPLYRSHNGTW